MEEVKIQVAANDLMHVFQPSCLNGETVEFLTFELTEGADNLRATLNCKHGVKKQYNVAVREGLTKIWIKSVSAPSPPFIVEN